MPARIPVAPVFVSKIPIDPASLPTQMAGEPHDKELMAMLYMARQRGVRSAFEIGTYRGRTALALSMLAERVYTLDLHTSDSQMVYTLDDRDADLVEKPGSAGVLVHGVPNVTQLWGNSRTFDFTPYYWQQDLVYVDASHDFDSTTNDLWHALQLIQGKGLIFVHDYAIWEKEVQMAVEAFWKNTGAQAFHIEDTSMVCLWFSRT